MSGQRTPYTNNDIKNRFIDLHMQASRLRGELYKNFPNGKFEGSKIYKNHKNVVKEIEDMLKNKDKRSVIETIPWEGGSRRSTKRSNRKAKKTQKRRH